MKGVILEGGAVIGVYMYDNSVFNLISRVTPSPREEFEISSVNKEYLKRNLMTYGIVQGEWTDSGTFESFQHANQPLFSIDNKIIEKEYHADTL
jgi:glucose-1-phosphate thymidylyltransferase